MVKVVLVGRGGEGGGDGEGRVGGECAERNVFCLRGKMVVRFLHFFLSLNPSAAVFSLVFFGLGF